MLPKRSILMTTFSGFQSQPVGGGGDDSAVGLVGNESIDVAPLQTIASQDFLAQFSLFADSELEHRLAILMNVVHALVHGFRGGGMRLPPPGM